MTPEQIRNQCEDDADRAPSDLTVWRDRGAIIAQQQARIAQLEEQVALLEDQIETEGCAACGNGMGMCRRCEVENARILDGSRCFKGNDGCDCMDWPLSTGEPS